MTAAPHIPQLPVSGGTLSALRGLVNSLSLRIEQDRALAHALVDALGKDGARPHVTVLADLLRERIGERFREANVVDANLDRLVQLCDRKYGTSDELAADVHDGSEP